MLHISRKGRDMLGDRGIPLRPDPKSAAPEIAASPAAPVQPRILILSDVKLYREGLAWSLSQRPEVIVVATCTPNMAALEQVAGSSPTTVLLDFATPGALNIPKELNRLWQGIKVIAFAVSEVEHELIACAEAGIQGFVTRDGSIDDLVTSILSAQRGEVFCSPRLTALLFRAGRRLVRCGAGAPGGSDIDPARTRNRRTGRCGAFEQGNRALPENRVGDRQKPCPQHSRKIARHAPRRGGRAAARRTLDREHRTLSDGIRHSGPSAASGHRPLTTRGPDHLVRVFTPPAFDHLADLVLDRSRPGFRLCAWAPHAGRQAAAIQIHVRTDC